MDIMILQKENANAAKATVQTKNITAEVEAGFLGSLEN